MKDSQFLHIYIYIWKRKWQPTPVLLPEEYHGQRSLMSCSSWGHNQSDTTESDLALAAYIDR